MRVEKNDIKVQCIILYASTEMATIMNKMHNRCSLVEYVMTPPGAPTKYDIGQSKFIQLLKAVKRRKQKCCQKNSTKYMYEDMVYEVSGPEVKTYRRASLSIESMESKSCHMIRLLFAKEKIPYYMFPSTMNICDIVTCSNVAFRIHNNVYLNFEVTKSDGSDEHFYKVYINYNHDKDADMTFIQTKINEALDLIGMA
jgi:hypothetical protein